MMRAAGNFTVAEDHPSLPGHFPGQPVVPGVLLLDQALCLILDLLPGSRVDQLATVRFLAPVHPGEAVSVNYTPPEDGRLAFTCAVAGQLVLRGTALLRI